MEQLKNEQTQVITHTAEAETTNGEQKTEVSLGKFKDAGALLSAYNSLESEFTKRCQKIKELEGALALADKEKDLPTKGEEAPEKQVRDITDEEKSQILREYLGGILGKKQTAVVLGEEGVSVKTPKNRPKTLKQAAELANEIFNK